MRDGRCTNKDALNAAQKLVNIDQVKMIIGGACSGESLAMLDVTESGGRNCDFSFFLQPGLNRSRTILLQKTLRLMLRVAKNWPRWLRNSTKKSLLSQKRPTMRRGFARMFKENVPLGEGEVVADENFAPETSDFRSILTKIKAAETGSDFCEPADRNCRRYHH